MPATVHDVAMAAGVSISTVSRVLNQSDHPVNAQTRQRVLEAARKLNYQPNLAARSLRTDRTGTIGIITDDITSPFSPITVRSIQDELREHGYYCVVINADWDPESEREAIRGLISRSIDGLIFAESWHREAISELDLANKPYVFVHRQFGAAYPYSVAPDEVHNARLAVRHLIDLGHRSIGYINGPPHYYASADRLTGYQMELAATHLLFDPALVVRGDWYVESGYDAARELLQGVNRPTAVFAANDLMAVGAMYAFRDAGLSVPEDIAVVGHDDREIAAIFRPSITTVVLPCIEMGKASAEMLLKRMAGHQDIMEEVKVRGRLIIRDSCGARLPTSLKSGQKHKGGD